MIRLIKYLHVLFYLQLTQSLRHTSTHSHQTSRSPLFFKQKIDMVATTPVKSMKINPKKSDDNHHDDEDSVEDDTASILPKQTAASSNSSNLSLTFSQLKPFLDIATPFFRDDKTARNSLIAVVALTLLNSGLSISFHFFYSLSLFVSNSSLPPISYIFFLNPSPMTSIYTYYLSLFVFTLPFYYFNKGSVWHSAIYLVTSTMR